MSLIPPRLEYHLFGLISNTAMRLYWLAPRAAIQDELLLIHRWALKCAHSARMKDPREQDNPISTGESDAYEPDE